VKKFKFLFIFIFSQIEEARDGLRKKRAKKKNRKEKKKEHGVLQSVMEKE